MRIKFKKINTFAGYYFWVLFLFLVFPNLARAGVLGWAGDKLIQGFGWIIYAIVYTIGLFLTFLLGWLVQVASWSNFINISTVNLGWVIIRDLCNMFFILILLVIAFATILRIESYNYKKLLPKLLIMAVLINFSKTICGLITDFSQVIMLTFVNGISSGASNNLVSLLGMDKMMAYNSTAGDLGLETVAGLILALLSAIVVLIVVAVMIAMLVMRVIMIWIYVILSPLAFLMAAFPAGQKYSSQWWGDFSKNVIVGPVLAFFLWLALMSAQNSADSLGLEKITAAGLNQGILTGLLEGKTFQTYIITLGLLIGGLMVTQQIGGIAGSMAGKGMAAIQKGGAFVGKTAALPLVGAKTFGGFLVDKLHHGTGVDLNLVRSWKVLQERRKEKKQEEYAEGQIVAGRAMKTGGRMHGILAMTGSPGDAYDDIIHTEGIVPRGLIQRLRGGRKNKERSDAIEPGLAQAEFESRVVGSNTEERRTDMVNLRKKHIANKEEIEKEKQNGSYADKDKINNLEKENKTIDQQIGFIQTIGSKVFSKKEQESYQDKAEKKREEYNKYQPRTPFEARAAEQKVVAAKMSKIKDISAPTELLRMLQDAIKQHDKTMVKAITLKMTRDYNDNEFLLPLAGDTSHVGLKKLMRDFSDKGSKNYAGFDQQEAFGLGSQIAELNKATNHWGATSSYLMDNGRWRETTDLEHVEIRTTETGKLHPQQLVRVVNRLGFGKHTGGGKYEIDLGGMITLKQLDSEGGIKQLKDNMTESTTQYLHANIEKLKASGYFSTQLLEAIEERARSSSIDFADKYNKASEALKLANES